MRTLGLAAVVMALCCACGAGPSVRPDVAVVESRPGSPVPTTGVSPGSLPALPVPVNELDWRDCTSTTLGDLGLAPGPDGLVLECATVASPLDVDKPALGAFALAVMRARMPQTPTDVAPLVLVTGADRPATSTLAALAAGPTGALLAARPLVAVDRRGIGMSTAVECGDSTTSMPRRQMLDLGQFESPVVFGGDIVDTVAAIGRDATTACTDVLQPDAVSFDAGHAADDLDQVRRAWGVDRIALLAAGDGVNTAHAYAAAHPGAVGRLVLDSPSVVGADAATSTEAIVHGRQGALAGYARQCAALDCSLGADPNAAITDLVNRARRGELGPISANALLTALVDQFGSPRADVGAQVREFSDVLSAAGRGDTAALAARIDAAAESDGQFVARCSEGSGWPTPGQVRGLMSDWATRYPVFGPEGALSMMLCAAWPTMPTPAAPAKAIEGALTIAGAADPVSGDGSGSASGPLASVGTPTATIAWLGSGHPAVAHSDCVQLAVEGYVDTGILPPDGGACPG